MHSALALSLMLVAAAAPPASDGLVPSQLSLGEAEQLFLEHGLDVLIAEYGAQAAEGDLRAAGAHPNPGLELTTTFTPATNHDVLYSTTGNAPVNLWGIGLSLTDNAALLDQVSGKRGLRMEASAKALVAAQHQVDEAKRVGLFQLRQAYVAAVAARLNLDAAQESFKTYDEQLALNQKRYNLGAINGLDLSRSVQAQLEAQQVVDQARSGLNQAMATLLFILGVRGPKADVGLTTGIDYAALPKLQAPDADALFELALEHRTDVKVAAANLEQARAALEQAKRARIPDISISLGYSEQCSDKSCSSEPAFNAGVSGNLPVLYQQQGEIQHAQSAALSAERTLEKAQAQVRSDVASALAAYAAAASQVQRMESKLLEQAKTSRDLAQLLYVKGGASFIDFMDAQRTYVASELEYHQDLANYWTAVFQLEQATGTSLH